MSNAHDLPGMSNAHDLPGMSIARRILIVTDQREVCRQLRSALDSLEEQFVIDEIPSGEEALLEPSLNSVDLLVTEYNLPGMTGLQLLKKVKTSLPAPKAILLYTQDDLKLRRDAERAGIEALVKKPVSPQDFLKAVESLLGLKVSPPSLVSSQDVPGEVQKPGLGELLAGMRQDMQIQSVMLVNDRGRVLARAGNLPDSEMESLLMEPLMAVFNAGQKVAQMTAQEATASWHIFGGKSLDLLLAPLDATRAVILAGGRLADETTLPVILHMIEASGPKIVDCLDAMEGPVIPFLRSEKVNEAPKTGQEPSRSELESMLSSARKKMKTDELDAFWSEADETETTNLVNADGLTYEQATKLGLLPGETEP